MSVITTTPTLVDLMMPEPLKRFTDRVEETLEPIMVLATPLFAISSIAIATFQQFSILSVTTCLLAIYSLLLYILLSFRKKTNRLSQLLRTVQIDSIESKFLLRVLSVQNMASDQRLRMIAFDKYPHMFELLGSFCIKSKESIELNQIDINKKPYSMLDFIQHAKHDLRSTSFGNIGNWWSRYESKRYLSETYRKISTDKITVKRLFIFEEPNGFDDEMREIMLDQQNNGIIVKTIDKRTYRELLLRYDSRTPNRVEDIVIIDLDFISVSEIDLESGDDVTRFVSLALDEASSSEIYKRVQIFDSIFKAGSDFTFGQINGVG